jgi:PAS domain S-box-containing protein
LYVNDAFLRLTGYERDACLGRSPRFLQGPDSSRIVLDRLRAALQTGQMFEGETWNYRADGTSFLMQWRVTPVQSCLTGERFFFASQHDVTELRRLESLAETTNLMENIGYVFSGIRHELGNPINSMKAALTLMRRGLDREVPPPPERLAETVDRVLDEIGRVEYLMRELRSFNALAPPALEWVDLSAFLNRFSSLVEPECVARGCDLVVELGTSAPVLGFCDPRGLHQALLNLVTNALDAMTLEGERISGTDAGEWGPPPSRPPLLTIRVRGDARGAWFVDVADTGPGIHEALLARIFEPFFTTKPTGTGLGLSLVQRVLARMGGTLSVRSEPGAGAIFTLLFAGQPSDVADES